MIPEHMTSAAFEARQIAHRLDELYLEGINNDRNGEQLRRIKEAAEQANHLANRLGDILITKMPEWSSD